MSVTRYLGYAGFFVFFFLIGLYLTFPWDVAKDRILALGERQTGMQLEARSLEPSWITGVEIEGLEITPPGKTPLLLDRVNARVHLLPLLTGKFGMSINLPIGKGEIDADVVSSDDTFDLEAKIDAVQVDLVPILLEASGLPLEGRIDLEADLVIGKKDPKLTEGRIMLKTTDFKIDKGGKLGMVPVPALELGNLTLEVPVKEGRAEFKNTRLPGTDLEISLDGTISPQYPLAKSSMNLTLGLKPTEKLLAADPFLRPILNNFQSAKDADGFYGISMVGSLQHPRIQPRR